MAVAFKLYTDSDLTQEFNWSGGEKLVFSTDDTRDSPSVRL